MTHFTSKLFASSAIEMYVRRSVCGVVLGISLRCDMDPAEVRRIETSRRDPGVRVVARLAAGLDAAPAELLTGILTPADQ